MIEKSKKTLSTLSEPKFETGAATPGTSGRAEARSPTRTSRAKANPFRAPELELPPSPAPAPFDSLFAFWFERCRGFVHICSSRNWPGLFLEIPAHCPGDPLEPHFKGVSGLSDFFFSTCTFKSERRCKDNVKDIPGVWADLDFKRFEASMEEAEERLRRFPFEPSILVSSGGGWHAYWKFDQPQKPSEDSIRLLKYFTEVLGCDPAATHHAQLLRVPGTLNSKYEQTRVEIDPRSSWETYSFEELLYFVPKGASPVATSNSPNVGKKAPHPEPLLTIPEKFHKLLEEDQRVRKTWKGNRPDLWDQSRSGYDFSMTSMLVNRGYTDAEILPLLREMPSGKGKEGTIAYFMHGLAKPERVNNFETLW